MNKVRRILVPVDFSQDSANDLGYAVSLAEETRAELVVLHVTQKKDADRFVDLLAFMEGSPMLNPPPRMPVDRLLREKALDLYHFIQKVVRNPGRLTIRRKVLLGNRAETILRVIKDEKIDLVVLTVKHKFNFAHMMTRENLLRAISKFPCAVVLKPPLRAPSPQPL